jgi:hypothetical protein
MNDGVVEDRVVLFIINMCLANYGASEAVNLCSISTWRNPPNVRNKTAPVILENKKVV